MIHPLLPVLSTLFSLHPVRGVSSCASSLKAAGAVDAGIFAAGKYDYLIIGGGTAGAALAARLTEDPRVQVGIIEAGIYHQGDPLLETPGLSSPGGQGNASYDWLFETTPQAGANGRTISTPRGKMVGGSSGLNLLAWTRASQPEYDAWSTFSGNSIWSWSGLTEYFTKSQTVEQRQANPFPGVSPTQLVASFTHGGNGPINASLNIIYTDIVTPYVETWNNLGIKTNGDADSGSTIGIWNSRMSIDRTHGIRSYAANSYFAQSCSRPNLHIITGAQVTKISLMNAPCGKYTATTVAYTVAFQTYTATASQEIVLSAGSVQTPQLLELSGIGNATLLESLGITPLINLPQVGENMQEHLFSFMEFELSPGHQTFDELTNNATFLAEQAALYASNHTGWFTANDGGIAFTPFQLTASAVDQKALLAAFDSSVANRTLTPIQKLQYKSQRAWIVQGNVPMAEHILSSRGIIAPQVNQSYLSLLTGAQHPVARGSIHINTSNPTAPPVINGNYLDNEFDIQTILQSIKFLLKLGTTAPLSQIIKTVVDPTVTSDDDLIQYIRSTVTPASHIIGTAALATQENGGVVDSMLMVYGTTNLRVVDASIIPFSIATHLQSTVYAIAEKAAGMIQGQ